MATTDVVSLSWGFHLGFSDFSVSVCVGCPAVSFFIWNKLLVSDLQQYFCI